MAALEPTLITFQPPIVSPPTVGLVPFSLPIIDTSTAWQSDWQPPIPKAVSFTLTPFSWPTPSDPSTYPVFQYVQEWVPPINFGAPRFDYGIVSRLLAYAPQPTSFIAPVFAPPPVCTQNLGQMRDQLAQMLDDPQMVYYTPAEMAHALNLSQRLFAFLTLCVERTVSFALTNAQTWYQLSGQISDFIAPLRILHSGTRLTASTIHDLDARDDSWRSTAGNPTRYCQPGHDLFAITPQPASGVHTLSLTYAAWPAEMTNNGDTPEIPADQQPHLIDSAYYLLRLKEGGQEGAAAVRYFQRFLQHTGKYTNFARAKNRAQHYDVEPLENIDISRFEWKLPKLQTKQIPGLPNPVARETSQ